MIGNYQKEEQEVILPGGYKKILLNNYHDLAQEGNTLKLLGYQAVILEMQPAHENM